VENHPVTQQDKAAMAAMRAIVEPNKGRMQGTAARAAFDGIMSRVKAPSGVTFHEDKLGEVSGWWCRPANIQPGKAIVHLHGGWFNWGSAQAFRHLVGHIAAQTQVEAFIPEYRLAPEHPFPAAIEDAQSCYRELANRGTPLIALTGDSAGGGLALSLLAMATKSVFSNGVIPVGAVVLSPVTDLTLSGQSWQSRAAADPYFIQSQAAGLVKAYLAGTNPNNPLASPLYGNLAGLPPIRIHVGDDEVLLDDSRRYVEQAIEAGVDAKLDVWEGMSHGFLGGIGNFNASAQVLEAIGEFLAEKFAQSNVRLPTLTPPRRDCETAGKVKASRKGRKGNIRGKGAMF
jgi:monoterpene epsilon-lactone hydrolase